VINKKNTEFNKIESIYARLQDDESRLIFNYRLQYYQSGDDRYLWEMLDELDKKYDGYNNVALSRKNRVSTLKERLVNDPRDIILYGAGCAFKDAYSILRKCASVDPLCICDSDSNKWNKKLNGLNIISPQELQRDHKDCIIVISGIMYNDEIYNYLQTLGFLPDDIYTLCTPKTQYFDLDIIPPLKHEVFIDAGCFDGQTILDFIDYCPNYKKIYALEPDPRNFLLVKEKIGRKKLRNLTLLEKGVWSSEMELNLSQSGQGSSIRETGNVSIMTTTVDDITKDDKVTFIKMDVEGAEKEAILGAQNAIINNKPKLAICIYHRPDDILEVPALLNELVPEYRFFIRHYSLIFAETVLYAII